MLQRPLSRSIGQVAEVPARRVTPALHKPPGRVEAVLSFIAQIFHTCEITCRVPREASRALLRRPPELVQHPARATAEPEVATSIVAKYTFVH